MSTASLYIHIPFCNDKCHYCDFFSIPVCGQHAALMDSYIDAVLEDISDQLAFFEIDHVPTVYIGGGTPSVLGAARLERLLAALGSLLKPFPVECTVEANPESADALFLTTCLAGGVTRLSLGIQSFHDPSRYAVHRTGGTRELDKCLALAAEYFPGAFSADLITGLPFQTMETFVMDMQRLLAFKPAHVSLYSLILEPQTPLGKKLVRPGTDVGLPHEDEADCLWIAGRDLLVQNGFSQYEVSNFAAEGKACMHNIRYWLMHNWLGIGPAASGTLIDDASGTGRRYTYQEDIAAYIAASRPRIHSAQTENLTRSDLIRETLLMGFRYHRGPDPHLFRQRFNLDIENSIPQTISLWRTKNFFQAAGTLAPSAEGLLFLNTFLTEAFNELTPCQPLPPLPGGAEHGKW